MMAPEIAQIIVGYIAIAVPITVAIGNLARVVMTWLEQRHHINTTVIQQTHNITSHYLDRALDPQVPLVFRHQLLRFLATPDKGGARLQAWAQSELARVGNIVDETNRAVEDAERELYDATNISQVDAAERKLTEALKKKKSLMEPPAKPPLTAATLRAGLYPDKELNGLDMKGANLTDMNLSYRNLRGADFSGSDLSGARFQGSDLRAARFDDAKMINTVFYLADIRGASFSGALIENSDFSQAHLEGVDFRDASIKNPVLRATYDQTTIWPDDFDPDSMGAVCIDEEEINED
jgi:uncharacterized protein YjbI with pentapeptide repeats